LVQISSGYRNLHFLARGVLFLAQRALQNSDANHLSEVLDTRGVRKINVFICLGNDMDF